MKCYHTLTNRPKVLPGTELKIPENATIWNAPRPLYGSVLMEGDKILTNYGMIWEGDFWHGVFYAATFDNPEAPWDNHARIVKDNIGLDAWVVVYATPKMVADWAQSHYSKEAWEIIGELPEHEAQEMIDSRYLKTHWGIDYAE